MVDGPLVDVREALVSLGLTPAEARRRWPGSRPTAATRRTCSARPCGRWDDERDVAPDAFDDRPDRGGGRSRPRTASSTSRCGRARSPSSSGQDRVKEQLSVLLDGPRGAANRSTTCCSAARRGSARRRWLQIVALEMGGGVPAHERARAGAAVGPRRHPHEPRGRRRAVHRRDPPDAAGRSRRCCTRRSRTSRWTSCSARGRPRGRSGWTCRGSRWSRPRRGPGGSRCRCASGSGSRRASTTTASTTSPRSSCGARASSGCDGRGGRGRDRAVARAARRGSRTGCCAGSATSPRSATTGAIDRRRSPARGSRCSRWTSRGWTGSTSRSCRAVAEKFAGGPVGLSTLAAAVGEEPDTIEDVVEPYLLQLGFLQRTPRGRIATAVGLRTPGRDRSRARCPCRPARQVHSLGRPRPTTEDFDHADLDLRPGNPAEPALASCCFSDRLRPLLPDALAEAEDEGAAGALVRRRGRRRDRDHRRHLRHDRRRGRGRGRPHGGDRSRHPRSG